MKIKIKRQDIIPYVYFVSSLAQQTKNGMFGALSTKSDLIGGIFDRWINIIPESLSFNQYFLPKTLKQLGIKKDVSVFSDFFMYNPTTVGIAPDVLGLKIDNKIVPFVKYDDTKEKKCFWVTQDDCPQIEVKSFFGRKYMVSLRDQHCGDKFLVMISAQIDVDYLLSFFNSGLFDSTQQAKLNMPNDFIISDTKNLLSQTKPVVFNKENIGEIEILTVTTADNFTEIAIELKAGDIPRYFVDCTKRKARKKFDADINGLPRLTHYFKKNNKGLYSCNEEWYKLFNNANEKTLDLAIENPDNIVVIGNTKNSLIVTLLGNAKINQQDLIYDENSHNQYNINFSTFGAVAGTEYFMNIGTLGAINSKESELISSLAEIIKKN